MAAISARGWQSDGRPRGRACAASAAQATRAGRSRHKLRKDVLLIDPEGKRPNPQHGSEGQLAVKMRKQITAARGLPFQLIAERVCVDRDQHQILSPGKIPRCGVADLRGGREVNEAVARIDGRTAEYASTLRLAPERVWANFVDGPRHGAPRSAARLDLPEIKSRPPKYDGQLTPAAPLTSSTAALGATALATSVVHAVALEIALFYFDRRGCKYQETVPIIGLAEPSERRFDGVDFPVGPDWDEILGADDGHAGRTALSSAATTCWSGARQKLIELRSRSRSIVAGSGCALLS